jgi:hypothetical protein
MTDRQSRPTADPAARTLAGWIEDTRALASRAQAEDVLTAVAAVAAHAGRGGVRVAVASSSARERARLINQLLGRQILPTDLGVDVPVLLTPGEDDLLAAETADGLRPRPVVDVGRWWRRGEPAVLAYRRQVSRSPILSNPPTRTSSEAGSVPSLGAEIFSTPWPIAPRLDPDDARWSALASADAVVLLTQATAPMALSEIDCLEELLRAGMSAGRALILLTRLDLVGPNERAEVLEFVRERARAVSPGLLVRSADVDGDQGALAAAVRDWIGAAVLPDAERARSGMLSRRLAGCLRRIEAAAAVAGQDAAAQRDRWAEQDAAMDLALTAGLRGFDEIREDMRGRHVAALVQFQQERDQFRAELTRTLLYLLERNPEPKNWWEKELPRQFRSQFLAWDLRVRLVLQDRVSTNVQALGSQLNSAYALWPLWPDALSAAEPASAVSGPLPLTNLRRRRLLYRTGPTGAALLAVLLFPRASRAALLTTSLATVFAELRLYRLVDRQRALIKVRLPALVNGVLDRYFDEMRAAVDPIYLHMQDEVERLREQWRQQRLDQAAERLAVAGVGPGSPDWPTIAADTAELICQIQAEAASGLRTGPVANEATYADVELEKGVLG